MGWWRRKTADGGPRTFRRRTFLAGVGCGVLLVYFGALFINRTNFADYLITSLLLPDTAGKADAIVVMGAGVVGDCVPNHYGVRRTLLGVRLWHQQRAPILFFTGASGEHSCPVATAMARLAREVGVPERGIQTETTSHSTRENGEHSAPLLRRLGVRRVLIVTDRLHMKRAAGTFAQLGFEVERASVPIYEGHPNNVSMLQSGAREYAALAYYRMHGWIADPTARPAHTEDAVGSGGEVKGGAPSDKRPMVVLGASYAGGWDPRTLGGRAVIVRGVSGQQSSEILARFDKDVLAEKPSAVILWGFINDVFRSAPADANATASRVRDNYAAMIDRARKNNIEPIIGTEVTMGPRAGLGEMVMSWAGALLGKESYGDRINAKVQDINKSLIELARRESVLVLDFQTALAGSGTWRRRDFTKDDGSHITPAGYEALNAYAKPVLEQHFARRPGAASGQ
jgi:uncharacterized SAM-binding protein YcdF (DUF218 family)/lysophospholipase L1-like esterase